MKNSGRIGFGSLSTSVPESHRNRRSRLRLRRVPRRDLLHILDDLRHRANRALGVDELSFDRKKAIIGGNLYGVDVMEWACHVAETAALARAHHRRGYSPRGTPPAKRTAAAALLLQHPLRR